MLASHFQPNQINTAIALCEEALTNELQLNKKIVSLTGEPAGPFALIAHTSYLFERIKDVKTIIIRLKLNGDLITDLSAKEDKLRPKKRIYRKKSSKRVQEVWNKGQEVHHQMKLDMESMYIFGNLLLDQWAHIVGYVVDYPEPKSLSFASIVDKVQAKDKGDFELLWQKHHQEIFWLFYQLRNYRNVFIEHMKVPRQRGTSRDANQSFKLFNPSSIGWIDDNQIEEKIKSIVHLAPSHLHLSSTNLRNWNMRNLLEVIFYNIDQIEKQTDRQTVWDVWNEVGGLTPSYDVTAVRLMRFTATSIPTIIDMISMHPEKVNLGISEVITAT